MKNAFVVALVASTTIGCATAQEGKPADSKGAAVSKPAAAAGTACVPAPTELVVKDLQPGTGQAIRFRSAVNMFYTGWVYDGCKPDFKGAQFDSNAGGQLPFSVMVGAGRVIKGWDEGLIGMKEKGKRLLIIPPGKAYGEREVAGGKIPANSTLVFEVDLAQIVYQPPLEPGKAQ